MKGNAKRGTTISFGSYALKALEQHWITDRQIEAARQALTREMKREGNLQTEPEIGVVSSRCLYDKRLLISGPGYVAASLA